MDAWTADTTSEPTYDLNNENDNENDNDNDHHGPPSFPTPGHAQRISQPFSTTTTKDLPISNVANTFKLTLPHANLATSAAAISHTTAAAADVGVSAHSEAESISGEPWTGPSCLRNYLVLGRLFKLHPDFDAAIEGILVRDAGGCVVLIHETRDEEWTRVVWSRLRESLFPRGMYDMQLFDACYCCEGGPREGALCQPESPLYKS